MLANNNNGPPMETHLNHSDRRKLSSIENVNDIQTRTLTLFIPNSNAKNRRLQVTFSELGSLGQVIKFLRNALGFSQEKLANRIPTDRGVGRAYLSRIESGTASNPTLSAIKAIAKTLYIEIESLIFLSLDTSNKAMDELALLLGMKEQLLFTWAKNLEKRRSATDGELSESTEVISPIMKKNLNHAVDA